MTKKVLLIGKNSSAYSLSPTIWGAAFLKLRMDVKYSTLDVKEENLESTLTDLIEDSSVRGFNVTNPYKELVARNPSIKLDEESAIIHAVNTVAKRKGVQGHSTDGYGAVKSLQESFGENCLNGKNILVLGAGGSGRSIALACSSYGLVYLANRTLGKAQEISRTEETVPIQLYSEEFFRRVENADVVINTLPMEKEYGTPILESLPGRTKLCLDIVYGHNSRFLELAKEKGHRALEGKWMLLHQAVKSFDYMFGKDAYTAMKDAIISLKE